MGGLGTGVGLGPKVRLCLRPSAGYHRTRDDQDGLAGTLGSICSGSSASARAQVRVQEQSKQNLKEIP